MTVSEITTVSYKCSKCTSIYTDISRAEECSKVGETTFELYEQLKDKKGFVLKIESPTNPDCHYILIGKIKYPVSSLCGALYINAMDSNDEYTVIRWLKGRKWSILTILEAVIDGWRPFSIPLFRGNDEAWNDYVAAMRCIPSHQLFDEAIMCITKRGSTWCD